MGVINFRGMKSSEFANCSFHQSAQLLNALKHVFRPLFQWQSAETAVHPWHSTRRDDMKLNMATRPTQVQQRENVVTDMAT